MKKRTKKLIASTLACVLSLGMLSACGSTQNSGDDVLVMGTNAAFPPFEFVTSEGIVGEFDGIDIAIADKIAKSTNKTLKIEDMEFEGLITAVQTGKVDMAVAGMTVNPERLEKVDFSDTYFVAAQSIIVAKDNTDINSAEDLKNNKKVAVVQGYTGDDIVTNTLSINPENILRVSRGIDAVQELKNGKLDAVVLDSATAKGMAEKNDLKIVEDPSVFETEEYAIAVKKGNKELLDQINKILSEMKQNGEIDALAEKYN